ncbi:dihydroorotate dehydrogenase B (NAD(+)), catalytic subunit [Endomicrobiia bacterium]|uniref:dihydroorotate dehydrogenase n=1 Tax=Endomicrobium trichonymphae TaxID=1408204 RepID=UPI000865E660|nr:dihydroorotate dehydrogenase [Candidatus Endomicrobium trichonymphae]GHT04716.1 dihydroorotate dehydrogenase B (NAD(+)), catalytic subunit [Endomicrobiia bacterium]BAV59283.1 dihydroorotate dehydrogenase, catalytic subunit [Candidatus Endomicrobium trichonymphae]GHT07691.1 dihydroorotate dehydrogenase B (NAD(+)), catalytic subunit [Endomicrobiia bacterium]GHT12008.1 dihydroorotate dehydrogenase B (NAD(+)), catalytic subunit [Endomicrobiia bacterium]GHT15131.1 dihydroorotate dehydrogenase B 
MIPDLSVNFAGIKLKNPVLTASGTFGYGYELADLIPLKRLGGVVTKTVTLEPRAGNLQPRIAEVASGILNSIGLQNIGVRAFIEEPLEKLNKIGVPVIVSVAGAAVGEYVETVKILSSQNGVSAIELNLSCPNLKKKIVCHDLPLMRDVIRGVKKVSRVPVIAKLSPLVTDISELALTAQNAGADGVTLTNTYPAMAVDIRTFKPKLSTVKGGMSGACIKPMSVRCVYDAYQDIKIPIIGCGGIMMGEDAVEFILAGAAAVSVGSSSLVSPGNLIAIIDGIEDILKEKNIKSVKKIIGSINKVRNA